MRKINQRVREAFSWSAWIGEQALGLIIFALLFLGVVFGVTWFFGLIGMGLDLSLDATAGSFSLLTGAAISLWDLANAHPLISALVVVVGYHLGKNNFKPMQWYKGHLDVIRQPRVPVITSLKPTLRERATRAFSWFGFAVVSIFLALLGLVALSAVAVAFTGISAGIGWFSGGILTALGAVWSLLSSIAVFMYSAFAMLWPAVVALAFMLGNKRWSYMQWERAHAMAFFAKLGLNKSSKKESENIAQPSGVLAS